MRILIAPSIFHKSDAAWHLTRNLAALFRLNRHITAVSAPSHTGISGVSLYPCIKPSSRIFQFNHASYSYEEWLKSNQCFSTHYLENDLENLLDVIDSFHPDLIISICRPMAEAAASLCKIRCFSYVHPAMFNRQNVPSEIMAPVNQVLSNHQLVQILSLKDLLMQDNLRFGFGPDVIMPFTKNENVVRFGTEFATLPRTLHTNRVCIFLNGIHKPAFQMKRIITSAFHGAPYAVYACYDGSSSYVDQNIHFLERPRPELLPGSIAAIHTGNDYYCNLCMAEGILQVIVSDGSFIHRYNGKAVKRYKIGTLLDEKEFSMETLYHAYRTILSNDEFDINCQNIKKQISRYGDLSAICAFL